MDIYFSPSLSDMRRRLEEAEEQTHQRQSEASQQQSKDTQAAMAQAADLENRKLELEDIKSQREDATKRYVAELSKSLDGEETSEDGIVNPLDEAKFELDSQKRKDDYLLKIKALDQDMIKHKNQMEAKKVDQSINRIKKKSTN